MAQIYPVAGSKIFIGLKMAPKTEVVLSDFNNQVWTEITGWTNAGSIGDSQGIGSQTIIGNRRSAPFKTTISGGTMENQFIPDLSDPGQNKFREAIESCKPFAFKLEWGAGCTETGTVTISNGSDAVVTWAGHGLSNGAPVVFTTTGGLPTGLTAGTTYYVIAADATSFSVAATPGGSAITTSSAGTGTHTATAQPAGETDMLLGLAVPGQKAAGDAATARLQSWSIAQFSNIITV